MKILLITGRLDYCNGVTTYLYYLIKKLSENNQIILIAASDEAASKFQFRNVTLKIIKELDFEERSILNYLFAVIKLTFEIVRFSPKIIHSNNHYTANIAKHSSVFIPLSIKLIQTIHSDFHNLGKLKKYNANKYIFVNNHLYNNAVIENLYLKNKSHIIYNGIEFSDKLCRMKDEHKITITVASRLEESKGIQIVIEALKMFTEEYNKGLRLLIAGTGNFEAELNKSLKNTCINYSFLGVVTDMKSIYKTTDIFIFPSLTDYFGYSWLEAVDSECFLIMSDFDGIQHLLEENENYFIFIRGSHIDLNLKIRNAIELGENRITKAKNLKNELISKYSAEQMATKTMQVYLE